MDFHLILLKGICYIQLFAEAGFHYNSNLSYKKEIYFYITLKDRSVYQTSY